jgi:hypothetical protein
MTTKPHAERAHSKYSASGAERWGNCPGSVKLSEGLPDKDSIWSIEGTRAHEVLEAYLRRRLKLPVAEWEKFSRDPYNDEMRMHAENAVNFIMALAARCDDAEVLCEQRVRLDHLHPEAFGTLDASVLEHWGTLHILDYKYGAGHGVSPVENLQMLFYAVALAHKYNWNFKRCRIWIIQPRIKGYDGPVFWELSAKDLRVWETVFDQMIHQVQDSPDELKEGGWCHWCKAKAICPLKQEKSYGKVADAFDGVPW